MLNNFITGLMRLAGMVMFFGGMGLLAYAVGGGYYHVTPIFHAIGWGVAGWVLFFSGMNLVQQYKVTENPVAQPQPMMPMPMPSNPNQAGVNRGNPWQNRTLALDDQGED